MSNTEERESELLIEELEFIYKHNNWRENQKQVVRVFEIKERLAEILG